MDLVSNDFKCLSNQDVFVLIYIFKICTFVWIWISHICILFKKCFKDRDGHAGLSGLRARKLCPPTASPLFAQSNLDNLPSGFNFKTYQFNLKRYQFLLHWYFNFSICNIWQMTNVEILTFSAIWFFFGLSITKND